MPYDEKGRFWTEKKGGIFVNRNCCYKPPPDYEDDPPPPMGASQEAIDKWGREHNIGGQNGR